MNDKGDAVETIEDIMEKASNKKRGRPRGTYKKRGRYKKKNRGAEEIPLNTNSDPREISDIRIVEFKGGLYLRLYDCLKLLSNLNILKK